ncbi:3-keto-5-aminohexanoate cleavage protein [Nocardioides sp. B-3]|uniref:3-keto-5-aminohexanoate cleavage protein n=1 Tax=Nocardioides sp. B-3 TaxID=2895565 RepID=UPI003FA559F7
MSAPLLITVAPTGAETTKADCPQLPTTPEELAQTAAECEAAGAAMIHIHVRDASHSPTLELPLLKEWVAAVRSSSSLVVQLSTGGSVHDPLDERLKVLDAAPDSCSLTMGTTNFGDDVFLNPRPFVKELYQLALSRGIAPEFELFDLGQVHALGRLFSLYGPPPSGRAHVDFVMGVPGGMPGHGARAGRLRRRTAPRGDLVGGHRHRALHAVRRHGVARHGRPPARGHGGRADHQPRCARGVQRAARVSRRLARADGPADAHDARRVPGAARVVLREK